MKSQNGIDTEKYRTLHKRKVHRLRILACMAILVAACTTYVLIRPAVTREIQCGIPEHTHTAACYTEASDDGTKVLTCGMQEHTHTDSCFSGGTSPLSVSADESGDTADGELEISLLYSKGQTQAQCPNGESGFTHSSMSGYIKLEPNNLDADLMDVTVTLSMPKKYVEKDSIVIPRFSTNSEITKYEILPVAEDDDNYNIGIHFLTYDKTQTLVLPFVFSFKDDVTPDNYALPVTASVSGGSTTQPNIYRPEYKDWKITKFVNSNRFEAFSRDGAEVVVTPKDENGNPYLDELTYVDFAFIVNNYTNPNCDLSDLRDASEITLTDALPVYTDINGQQLIAAFDADKNPGWELSADGTSVSKTYSGENSEQVMTQIYNDALHLRFPGLAFDTAKDGSLIADLDNTVSLTAVPSNELEGETHPSASDPLRFRLTTDTGTGGLFTKAAAKGNIYDVNVYKTNPYPWNLCLSNDKMQPLRHITIQDRKIVEDGEVKQAGLDEALKFVRLESNAVQSKLPEGKTFADIVDKVVAYYTDGTTQDFAVTKADAVGNFTVTFDEDKVCNGYDIVFCDDYEMNIGESAGFVAYTVYRDPENTHVPNGEEKVTYTNTARSVNSYQKNGQTVYAYLMAGHRYDMLPSAEKVSIEKVTLCNNETQKLWNHGGDHVGDIYFYLLRISGTMLEPDVKEYKDVQIVDLLPDGVSYDKLYLIQQEKSVGSILDGGTDYQPEIIENYHNSGRTAVIFHLNGENLQKALKTPPSTDIYFGVKIDEDARPGTNRNYVYLAGADLDEYPDEVGSAEDIYDLNNNGRTDDRIACSFSDATIIAAQSIYAEKFIAPAGSDDWNRQGLYLKAGSEFDYLLKVTNETVNDNTGLVVYDTLPRTGDKDVFGSQSRNSEFPVSLRGAIVPPEGYKVFYTTSGDVYNSSMHDMVKADIWTESVADYSKVTAFKLVAEDGSVLKGQSAFQVRIPVRAAETFDSDAMELLHSKPGSDRYNGTMTYLEAINSFGFKTDQATSEKSSNNVWARVPFAGFCLKKIDGASREALAGAEFALKDADGNVIGTCVSDEQGLVQFRDLTEGVYTLSETKVPDGYMDKHLSITVTITQNAATMEYSIAFDGDYSGAGNTSDPLIVENYGTYELPETGGVGTEAIYALGALLTAFSACIIVRKCGKKS